MRITRTVTCSRSLARAGLLVAAAVGLLGLSLLGSDPASAQFWGGWGGGSWSNPPRPQRSVPPPSNNPFRQLFAPYGNPGYQQQAPARPAPQADFSKAPAPRKPDTAPTTTIAVLGDSMADWLAYGLEDVFSDSPEIGIVRKNRTYSGLIRYDSRSDTDWARMAREILAADKPAYVVMMIGLNDRQPIRERVVARAITQQAEGQGKDQGKDQPAKDQPAKDPTQTQPDGKPGQPDQAQAKPPAPPQPSEPQEGPDQPSDQAATAAHEAVPAGRNATYEFRTDKWEELYGKLIDSTIAALKSKGAPVFWVGLPGVRGTKSMSDIAYLNSLFRGHAEKAGIVYVDVWDGFVDEGGHFDVQGPDFEGQTRRLRTSDGVHFTKAGALKLAHYVEREIRRVMQGRAMPAALPVPEESAPAAASSPAKPGEPPAGPVAGPVVPLTTFSGNSEELIGGAASRKGADEPAAARVLVKGEPVPTPKGRADDFAWPRSATVATEGDVIAIPSAAPASSGVARPPATASPSRPSQGAGQGGHGALGDAKGDPKGGPDAKGEHRPTIRKPPAEDARAAPRAGPSGSPPSGTGPRPPAGVGQQGAPAARSGGFFGGLFGGGGGNGNGL